MEHDLEPVAGNSSSFDVPNEFGRDEGLASTYRCRRCNAQCEASSVDDAMLKLEECMAEELGWCGAKCPQCEGTGNQPGESYPMDGAPGVACRRCFGTRVCGIPRRRHTGSTVHCGTDDHRGAPVLEEPAISPVSGSITFEPGSTTRTEEPSLSIEVTAAPTADSALEAMLRSRILAILEEPLTPKTCNRLIKLANAIKQLLYVLSGAPPLKKRRGNIVMPNGDSLTVDELNDDALQPIAMSPGFNGETMGTAAVTQIVDALKSIDAAKNAPRIDHLIDAYQKASDAGLDDVAQKLKVKIDTQVAPTLEDAYVAGAAITVDGAAQKTAKP